jgi:hypothetical protein
MTRVLGLLAGLYRRWKFVEEEAPTASNVERSRSSPEDERTRLKKAVERDRKMVDHYRRNGCETLARDREASVRAMERRIQAMELGGHRAP